MAARVEAFGAAIREGLEAAAPLDEARCHDFRHQVSLKYHHHRALAQKHIVVVSAPVVGCPPRPRVRPRCEIAWRESGFSARPTSRVRVLTARPRRAARSTNSRECRRGKMRAISSADFARLKCAFRLTYFVSPTVSNLMPMLMLYCTTLTLASVTDLFSPSSRPLSATIFMVTLGRVGQRSVRCNSLRARPQKRRV